MGGVVLQSQNPKCQDLSKFQFSGVGGGRGRREEGGGGRNGEGVVLNRIPEQGCSVQFGQKFLEA